MQPSATPQVEQAFGRTFPSRASSYRGTASRPPSLASIPDLEATSIDPTPLGRTVSGRRKRLSKRHPPTDLRVQALRDASRLDLPSPPGRPAVNRHSSLRTDDRTSKSGQNRHSHEQSLLRVGRSETQPRHHSYPPYRSITASQSTPELPPAVPQPAKLPRLQTNLPNTLCRTASAASANGLSSTPTTENEHTPRPKASLRRLSSLDNLLTYREEKERWKRASSILQQRSSATILTPGAGDEQEQEQPSESVMASPDVAAFNDKIHIEHAIPAATQPPPTHHKSRFRHITHEIGFCFSIAMTQFLAEYLISGFAIEVPRLFSNQTDMGLGLFWPASLLSLVLSATLLIFARLSDLYGGYPSFMFGAIWLTVWSVIPAFCHSQVMIDISRAMEGLALAAFMPSTFAMVATVYEEGPRKNFVIGLYSGCAPLGFFAGFLVAGALPQDKTYWFFWIAAVLAFTTLVGAYLTVPNDRTDRKKMDMKMDWVGSFFITAGLLLLAYSLAVEPYANQHHPEKTGFTNAICWAPFASGILSLGFALYWEGWKASCPLLPFDFFKPRSVKAFCFAGLCFYASYGVWLYMSAEFLQSPTCVTGSEKLMGIELALWYTPTAVGGIILCVIGGCLAHIVPIKLLLLVSGLAWIAAPLLLALAPLPLQYWTFVMPSMVCATIGIDLTFTVSLIFLAAVQPQRYQGVVGAVSSILVNLAMSFALPISEIIMKKAEASASSRYAQVDVDETMDLSPEIVHAGYKAAFLYGAASAGLGLIISVFFVHISREVVGRKTVQDEEQARETSSSEASTLIGELEQRHGEGTDEDEATPVQSTEYTR
ncbi:MFS general substrate transporter [Hortaea werneckii]|nr:MFS general substrate transporter [Hortaea werneckii]KAI7107596.1 MFS general substrate transporter [Hortaea werneckii]